jgi:hypothetical protein
MSRAIELTRCYFCPHLKRTSWRCTKTGRELPHIGGPIPDWCPLPVYEEAKEKPQPGEKP